MKYATLTRKANFSYILKNKYQQINRYLTEAENYYKKFEDKLETKNEKEIHNATILMGQISWFEAFLNDIISEFLICFPSKLENKQYKIKDIIKDGSITNTIKNVIDKRVTELSYKNFNEMLQEYCKYLAIDYENFSPYLNDIQEIKATRNLYVHNNGIINNIYIDSAGVSKRGVENGKKLEIDSSYILTTFDILNKFLEQLVNDILIKYKHIDKTYVFNEMWKNSYFKNHSMFEECWEYSENILVGSTQKTNNYGWSSSEELLFNFYKSIYYGFSDTHNVNFPELFRKWSPESNDGQIIMSWLDNPFYF